MVTFLTQANAKLSLDPAPKVWPTSAAKTNLKATFDRLSSDLAKALFGFSRHVRKSYTVSVPTITLKAGHGAGEHSLWFLVLLPACRAVAIRACVGEEDDECGCARCACRPAEEGVELPRRLERACQKKSGEAEARQ